MSDELNETENPEVFDLKPRRLTPPEPEPTEEELPEPEEVQEPESEVTGTEPVAKTPKPAETPKPEQNPKPAKAGVLGTIFKNIISEFKPIRLDEESPENRRKKEYLIYRRQRGAAGSVLILHALLIIFLMIVWAAMPQIVFGIDKTALNGALFSTLLTQGITVLLPSVLIIYIYNMDVSMIAGRQVQSPTVFVLAGLLGIPAAIAFSGINNITLFVLSQLGLQPTSDSLLGQISQPSNFLILLLVLITALIPALCEELMFRGVIQTSLGLSGRKWLSIILMATAFTLYHGDPYFLFAPFLAGVYLGVIRHQTDNLYVTILMHFVMNSTLVLLQPYLPFFTSSLSFAGTAGRTALYASLIAAAVALVSMIPLTSALATASKKTEKPVQDPLKKRLHQEQWFPADWKYMLALILLFVLMWVLNG